MVRGKAVALDDVSKGIIEQQQSPLQWQKIIQ